MMPERTITCPNGCHEDYLRREHIPLILGKNIDDEYNQTLYLCRKCEWEGSWTLWDGMKTVSDGFVATDEYYEQYDEWAN